MLIPPQVPVHNSSPHYQAHQSTNINRRSQKDKLLIVDLALMLSIRWAFEEGQEMQVTKHLLQYM
jgi:hypothetical protein